nr:hypothetical protein [Syntrophobacteraceae bacterium]
MIFSEQPSVEDPFGNTMTITYTQDQKTAYPARIDYTGNGSLPPTNSVEFVLDAAPTSGPSNYVPHFEVRIDRRLKTVKVRRDGDVVRRYELAYTSSPITSRSLLRSITQYGSSSNHLPSITMEWTQGADGFSSDELLAGGLPNCDDTMNFPERYR